MAFQLADRVKETSVSPGAGTANLAGPVQGFQSFVQGVGNGDICTYCMTDGAAWEVGYGQVAAGTPDTLQRIAVIKNSDQGTVPINFTGTVDVFVTPSGLGSLHVDNNGAIPFLPGLNRHLFRDGANNDLVELTADYLDVKAGVELRIGGRQAITNVDETGIDGYIQLGPILLQWGGGATANGGPQAFVFPTPFSETAKSVTATCLTNGAERIVTIQEITATGFNAYSWSGSGANTPTVAIRWQAIGLA